LDGYLEESVEMGLIALFIIFAAVIGSAAMVGVLAYFLSRIRRLEGTPSGGPGSHQLTDQVNGMAEELMSLQSEVSRLTERLDFTEKLLMSGEKRGPAGDSE
jgi:hypothetical protein